MRDLSTCPHCRHAQCEALCLFLYRGTYCAVTSDGTMWHKDDYAKAGKPIKAAADANLRNIMVGMRK